MPRREKDLIFTNIRPGIPARRQVTLVENFLDGQSFWYFLIGTIANTGLMRWENV